MVVLTTTTRSFRSRCYSTRVPPLVEVSSSDPHERGRQYGEQARERVAASIDFYRDEFERKSDLAWEDRKSTRLNSSHQIISYAVFCLKKKKNTIKSKY